MKYYEKNPIERKDKLQENITLFSNLKNIVEEDVDSDERMEDIESKTFNNVNFEHLIEIDENIENIKNIENQVVSNLFERKEEFNIQNNLSSPEDRISKNEGSDKESSISSRESIGEFLKVDSPSFNYQYTGNNIFHLRKLRLMRGFSKEATSSDSSSINEGNDNFEIKNVERISPVLTPSPPNDFEKSERSLERESEDSIELEKDLSILCKKSFDKVLDIPILTLDDDEELEKRAINDINSPEVSSFHEDTIDKNEFIFDNSLNFLWRFLNHRKFLIGKNNIEENSPQLNSNELSEHEMLSLKHEFDIPENFPLLKQHFGGILWMRHNLRRKSSCILADEKGLGKMIQVFGFLSWLQKESTRTLFVYPNSSLPKIRQLSSQFQVSIEDYQNSTLQNNIQFVSIDNLINHIDSFKQNDYEVIILTDIEQFDQDIINTSFAKHFSSQFTLITVSGDSKGVRQHIFKWLPLLQPTLFSDTFVSPLISNFENYDMQRILLEEFILRRTLRSVKASSKLPRKSENIIRLHLTPIQRQLYHAYIHNNMGILLRNIKRASVLNVLQMNLQRICMHPFLLKGHLKCEVSLENFIKNQYPGKSEVEIMTQSSSKLTVIDKLLQEIVKQKKEKVVIVSSFNSSLDLLQDFLECKGIGYRRFERNSSKEDREHVIKDFSTNPTLSVFLLRLKPRAYKKDLTAANNIIFFNTDYNIQSDKLALSWLCQPEQKKIVNVYRLMCQDSIEESNFHLPAHRLFGDDTSNGNEYNSLSNEELDLILQRGVSRFLKNNSSFCVEDSCSFEQMITGSISLLDFRDLAEFMKREDPMEHIHRLSCEFWSELFPNFVDIEELENQFDITEKFSIIEATKFFDELIKYCEDFDESLAIKSPQELAMEDELRFILGPSLSNGESRSKRSIESLHNFLLRISTSLKDKFPPLREDHKEYMDEKLKQYSEWSKKRKRTDTLGPKMKRPRQEDPKKKSEGKSKRGRKSKLHVKQEIGERLVEFDGKLFPMQDTTEINGITTRIRFPSVQTKQSNQEIPTPTFSLSNPFSNPLIEGTIEDSFTSEFSMKLLMLAPCPLNSLGRK